MEVDNIEFIGVDNEKGVKMYRCPLCGDIINVGKNVFYGKCEACSLTFIDFIPQKHQMNFHTSKVTYKLNIGGYGSGKTTMGAYEIFEHCVKVANGKTLITAQTLKQVEEAVLPELEKFIPPWYIKKIVRKPNTSIELVNGHKIIIFPSNDEEKLRSLNLTAFWIIEASGVDYKIFVQLQSRLRNTAALIVDENGEEIGNNFVGLVESNPEEGWIRDNFLLKSDHISASKSVNISRYKKLKTKKPNKNFHTFLSSSVDNKYLPKDFVQNLCDGKDRRWIDKYVYCELTIKEGAVYEEFIDNVVDDFPIPDNWVRMYGFDKGWVDDTVLVCGAVDPKDGVVYIYKGYFANKKAMAFHAQNIKMLTSGFKLYRPIQADPSVKARNDRDGTSYFDNMINYGVYFELANNSILDGIDRVKDLFYLGKLKIFTSCVQLKVEAEKYKWKTDKDNIGSDKPIDKFNHGMDSLRYLVMGLPSNPKDVYGFYEDRGDKYAIIDRIAIDEDEEDGVFNSSETYGL